MSSKIEIVDQIQTENPLRDKWFRLNNLYYIRDKHGTQVKFRLNTVQTILFEEMWYRNNILKARQLGFTTFIDIYILDEIIFNPGVDAGIIAHREKSATKIFRNKIKYPYDHLSDELKRYRPAKITAEELTVTHPNNDTSSVYVSVTLRSDTVQYLHISEFGYVCRKYPDRSEEIVTGALQAIHRGEIVWIESTAMGKGGYHYDYCMADMALEKEIKGKTRLLSVLDRKFFFFPWYRDPENQDETVIPIKSRMRDYFLKLEVDHGIKLSKAQKYWYIRKEAELGEKMKAEHPSTPEEAFEASIKGAIFADAFIDAREEGRICDLPIRKDLLIDTWWDLGLRNRQAIWFTQTVGGWVHVIGYYENKNRGIIHYVDWMRKNYLEKGYEFGKHYAPHDIGKREWSDAETRWSKAQKKGITFIRIPMIKDKKDSIENARDIFAVCKIDRVKCDIGIIRLENYRYEYDDNLGIYQDKPFHDENSNAADAFQTLGAGHDFHRIIEGQKTAVPIAKSNYIYA